MDYEHLYSYLESRPLKEQKACMKRIVQLVSRQCNEGENFQLQLGNEETRTMERRQQIAEQLWTQEAVWCKFGDSNVEHASLNALTLATAPLYMKPKVAQYLVTRYALIDNEIVPEKSNNSPKQGNTATARMKPPPLTVPAVHPNKHYTPPEHTGSSTGNGQPEINVAQNGEVSRLPKRGRDGNRFDDKDFRVPYYPKSKQSFTSHIISDRPASQPRPVGYKTDMEQKEEGSQNAKKPRRANFFD